METDQVGKTYQRGAAAQNAAQLAAGTTSTGPQAP
jgi:hypothetical protein